MQEIDNNKSKIWVADNAGSYFQSEWFNSFVDATEPLTGKWQLGRQSVIHFNANGYYMVMRHYCRGGLPAKFSRDKFIFHGWSATRACRELALLEKMVRMDLPVPTPVAARSELNGIFYTSDIITHEINDSRTLAQVLMEEQLTPPMWQQVGRVIKQFHVKGIEHVDLNANNILLDAEDKIYLIDFDRCLQRKYSDSWGTRGLQRLKRSLLKIRAAHKHLAFTEQDYCLLLAAYEE